MAKTSSSDDFSDADTTAEASSTEETPDADDSEEKINALKFEISVYDDQSMSFDSLVFNGNGYTSLYAMEEFGNYSKDLKTVCKLNAPYSMAADSDGDGVTDGRDIYIYYLERILPETTT
jgi:hypothetical protein